jgi:excisionase family DNA binding protein
MTKTEAAEYLGMSERSLERHTKDNRIGVRYERGKTKKVPVYDAGELDRFKAELEAPVHRPAVEKMPPNFDNGANASAESGAIQLARPDEFLKVIEGVINATAREVAKAMAPGADNGASKRQTLETPLKNRAFLSVEESAAHLGISQGSIEKAIKAQALTVHRGLARGRRIKRVELDKWAAKL